MADQANAGDAADEPQGGSIRAGGDELRAPKNDRPKPPARAPVSSIGTADRTKRESADLVFDRRPVRPAQRKLPATLEQELLAMKMTRLAELRPDVRAVRRAVDQVDRSLPAHELRVLARDRAVVD